MTAILTSGQNVVFNEITANLRFQRLLVDEKKKQKKNGAHNRVCPDLWKKGNTKKKKRKLKKKRKAKTQEKVFKDKLTEHEAFCVKVEEKKNFSILVILFLFCFVVFVFDSHSLAQFNFFIYRKLLLL